MPFLTEVRFQNYRSFLDAGCRLAPVTVVIGANNAGKSNFLRNVRDGVIGDYRPDHKLLDDLQFESHRNHPDAPRRITLCTGKNSFLLKREPQPSGAWVISPNGVLGIRGAGYYELNEKLIGNEEAEIDEAFVQLDGRGVTGLMRWLQINDETAFRRVEEDVRRYVPEVEELVPKLMGDKKIRLEAKERGLDRTSPLAQLSAGSRIIIALLAILHQPVRPELILLEDIEHAIHPRGLKPLVETMRRISKERGAQIIFTTQSPYVLDAFQAKEYWDDVVIVEKHDGVSTLTNARDRLEALGYEREMTKVPLGDLCTAACSEGLQDRMNGGIMRPLKIMSSLLSRIPIAAPSLGRLSGRRSGMRKSNGRLEKCSAAERLLREEMMQLKGELLLLANVAGEAERKELEIGIWDHIARLHEVFGKSSRLDDLIILLVTTREVSMDGDLPAMPVAALLECADRMAFEDYTDRLRFDLSAKLKAAGVDLRRGF